MKYKVVHCKIEPKGSFIYVGRPTKYGNLFSHKGGTLAKYVVGSVSDAVDAYEKWIMEDDQEWLRKSAKLELAGRNLGCWGCNPCHADILLRIANEV